MAVDKIRRGAAEGKVGYPNANTIRVDPTTETLRFGTGTSGTTEKQASDTSSAQTFTNKTLTSPTINTPTIATPSISNPSTTGVKQDYAAAGAAGGVTELSVTKVLVDNTATDFITVTIPNAIAGGSLDLLISSMLGDGDSTDTARYTVGISRIAGANAKAVASSKSVVGATSGATANAVITAAVSAISGAVGAVNTFTITIKNARSVGSADNHPTTLVVKLINLKASGVTVAAA